MSGLSSHIIATRLPPGFAKRRHVTAHFSKFGNVVQVSIQKHFCIVSFENVEQAQRAVLTGTEWRGMPVKVDFTPVHDIFSINEATIKDELNWYAEEPEVDKPRHRSRKSELSSKVLNAPPQKLPRVDGSPVKKGVSQTFEESRSGNRSSTTRGSATTRFLGEISQMARHKEDNPPSFKSTFSSRLSRNSEEDKFKYKKHYLKSPDDAKALREILDDVKTISKFSRENESRSPPSEDSLPVSPLSEDMDYLTDNEDEEMFDQRKRAPSPTSLDSLQQEDSTSFPDNKTAAKQFDEIKLVPKSSGTQLLTRVALTLKDKYDILEERDKLIRVTHQRAGMETVVQGTCPDMCPEKERILRELRRLVEPYEALSDGRMDEKKAIKEYTRSSADQGNPLPHELRPEPVLTMTMSYLIDTIISRIDQDEEENLNNWYNFCWGRLRAVRKDIIQQDLRDKNTVTILEQCARFHIACYDRLRGLSKFHFDDKLNTEALNGYLTMLIGMYEDLNLDNITCPNEAEFNSYLILLNMNNSGFLASKYQVYPRRLKESDFIKEAAKIHLAYHNNMFSTYFKLTRNTSYLNACLAQRFFQHVRVEALNTIVKSHSIPNNVSSISVDYIMNVLKLDSVEDCISFCESSGLVFNKKENCFRVYRNDFNSDYIYLIETPSLLMTKKRKGIGAAVLGSKTNPPIYLNHKIHNSFSENGLLNETALDASDQEEQMLRDDIERKLLHSQRRSVSHKEKPSLLPVSPRTEDALLDIPDQGDTAQPPVSSIKQHFTLSYDDEASNFVLDTNESEMSQTAVDGAIENESVSLDVPLTSSTYQLSPSTDNNNKSEPVTFTELSSFASPYFPKSNLEGQFIVAQEFRLKDEQQPSKPASIHFSKSFTPFKSVLFETKLSPPLTPSENSKGTESTVKSVEISPPPPKESMQEKEIQSPKKSDLENLKERVTGEQSKGKRQRSATKGKLKTFWSTPAATTPYTKLVKHSFIETEQSSRSDKLRKTLKEKMKRISARKYLRRWKEKVAKLKSNKDFQAMVVLNMSTKDYLNLWGKPSVRQSHSFADKFSTRKRSNVMVHMILHSDILNKKDKNIRNVGRAVVDRLGVLSVKKADEWGNISQPNPVFWKLVFALPPQPEGGTTFGAKLRDWCQTAFYKNPKGSRLSKGELHMSESGVSVAMSVQVVEGVDDLSSCRNLTALVVVRGRSWETTSETRERIHKLVALSNHPIPLAVLNVGPHLDFVPDLVVSPSTRICHLEQVLWDSPSSASRAIVNLASNTHLFNFKVKPFNFLVEICSEVLFDSLRQDSYVHDGLEEAINNPNNIISVYNQLIMRIEQELVECKSKNYFGTAYEFKEFEKYSNLLQFPEKYDDLGYETSLSLRCQMCRLKPMKLELVSVTDLINYFRNYLDDLGCPKEMLRTLIRDLHIPRDRAGLNLHTYLLSLDWLPIVENLVKEILTSSLLTFKVVYRVNVIKNILESHFWFELGVIQK